VGPRILNTIARRLFNRTQTYWPEARKDRRFSKEAWMFLFLTAVSMTVLLTYVDLTPHVDNEFFFSSEDPDYQADIKISKSFARKDTQLLISVAGDIHSREYQNKISRLSGFLAEFDSVPSVFSITRGPKNLDDALRSPFWSRLLISESKASTNIVAIIDWDAGPELISNVENLVGTLEAPDFQVRISGFPYVTEMIRRNLLRDLQVFSLLALILFGIVIIFIFHSWRILAGMIVTCGNACAMTFMATHYLGLRIGILTANLTTIVFVLTLSHLIFLTFNWKHLHLQKNTDIEHSSVYEAIMMTWPASFWCMITTLMGFLSLLFVQAKPLRELGLAGALGTFIAFALAYGIYPSFLRLKRLSHDKEEKNIKRYYYKTSRFFEKYRILVVIGLLGFLVMTAPKIPELNTDPSLMSYFAAEDELAKGLQYIDRQGGSNPLVLVVKSRDDARLNTNKAYERLWRLQKDLENLQATGTVISLPVLIAEGKRRPFSFLFSTEKIVHILEGPEYDHIAKSFLTSDHKETLFLIRMREEGRQEHRLEIIKRVEKTVRDNGFEPHLVGGIYALQGRLSAHIASSLVFGLGRLIGIFALIALIVGRSLRTALAMIAGITAIPLAIFGWFGFFRVPLDIICAPAANVAIGMGIDAMIHITHAHRRLRKKRINEEKLWSQARKQMWEPVMTSMFIVSAGFGIFFFSSFPPTQRFGGAIVLGTVVAALTALFIFPALCRND
jgi:predicted RND superfamily exporter protein